MRADLEAGRLMRVLEAFPAPTLPLQMVFPPGRSQPRRVRAFADQLAAAIRGAAG